MTNVGDAQSGTIMITGSIASETTTTNHYSFASITKKGIEQAIGERRGLRRISMELAVGYEIEIYFAHQQYAPIIDWKEKKDIGTTKTPEEFNQKLWMAITQYMQKWDHNQRLQRYKSSQPQKICSQVERRVTDLITAIEGNYNSLDKEERALRQIGRVIGVSLNNLIGLIKITSRPVAGLFTQKEMEESDIEMLARETPEEVSGYKIRICEDWKKLRGTLIGKHVERAQALAIGNYDSYDEKTWQILELSQLFKQGEEISKDERVKQWREKDD
ncbi:hypothetical protein HY483_00965 [Candidatus Woesearchaeota archaeon]|nr:hypothetical protein [Candidatus Woesearchaeota archaeon]